MKIGIVGLGYVGLPLAALMAKKYQVTGYDINQTRIIELKNGFDKTGEVDFSELQSIRKELQNAPGLYFTDNKADLDSLDFYIITVPTPIDSHNLPDLSLIKKATETVGSCVKKGSVVIYESTVYPGVTEEVCVPILEKTSGLKYNEEFYVGYSPERINPADKKNTIDKIVKITAGSNIETARKVDALYSSVITAGTHRVSSIRVAEAAKVIENAQRDLNIAFVNELSKIFNILEINTNEVLKAAATKWNFQVFTPGLVGGHCIGIDPYYLAYKADKVGYFPEIILAGRKINESMGNYVAERVKLIMASKQINIESSEILVLGITFKENCSDIRNSKVVDVIDNLKNSGANITIYDPQADPAEVKKEYNLVMQSMPFTKTYDALVLAVAHEEFRNFPVLNLLKEPNVIFDLKGFLKIPVDETL